MSFHKRHYRFQEDEKDCGVAALAMILEYYGSHYSLATLRRLAKTSQDGTTAYGLTIAAKALHLEVNAYQSDLSLLSSDVITYPWIAHVMKEGEWPHYYTIIASDRTTVTIADPDPSVGITTLSHEQFLSEWTGVALLFHPTDNYQPYQEKHQGLWSFLPLLKQQKRLISGIVIATFLMTIINIIGAYYLQLMIDVWIPAGALSLISMVALGLLISYTVQQGVTYLQSQWLVLLGQRLSLTIILGYIEHLLHLPLEFFHTRKIGEMTSRFMDANAIIEALASTVLSVFLDLSIALVMAIVLCVQHPLLFLIAMIALPIYAIIVSLFTKKFQRLNQSVMEANAHLSSAIIDDLNGIETIKSLGVEAHRYQDIQQKFHAYLEHSFHYARTENSQTAFKTLLHLVLNVIILRFGAQFVVSGQMTLGQLITFNALLVYFTNPLENIVNLQTKLQRAHVANERLNEIQRIDSEFTAPHPLLKQLPWQHQITLSNINFAYGYEANVLNNVNLTINKGDKIAVVGLSGSGKTTLAKLLVNFYTPNTGAIHLDNLLLQEIDKHTLRQLITYLPQKPYLFNGTLRENLLLGAASDTSDNAITAALQLVELYDDVMRLPLQLQTTLTSDGMELSGGQQQRLALARALLTNSSILILDEATSGLDVLTEKVIIDRLLKLDKTIIFIAHRLTVAQRSDRVIVMSKGEVVEEGSHAELLKKGGLYAQLINT
ncbi:MAG: peptide cleavage/export ABC transporter [Aerococcus sp.]|nr:peptide cleavage/export ABC transporter [Aerococcus sp.]